MTNTRIDLKQREHLVSFAEQAKREEKERLEEQLGASRQSVINDLAKRKGAAQFLAKEADLDSKIRALKDDLQENEGAFKKLGFEFRDDDLCLAWHAPDSLKKEFEQRLVEARRPIEKSLKKYDLMIARIWTATSGEEMQKAVEGLI